MKRFITIIAIAFTTLLTSSVNANAQDNKTEILSFDVYSYDEWQTITTPVSYIINTDETQPQGCCVPGCMIQIKYRPSIRGEITCDVIFISPTNEEVVLTSYTSRILTLIKINCIKNNVRYANYCLKDRYDDTLFNLMMLDDGYVLGIEKTL